jgi:hypothetical protein
MDLVEGELAGIVREVAASEHPMLLAYLHGAMRDGTFNRRHGTYRISQRARGWLDVIQHQISLLGRKSWIYREGDRSVWVIETKLDLSEPAAYGSLEERRSFARGYFDAEGGVPRMPAARFYVQFVQRDIADLERLRDFLIADGISCGRPHNPSWRVDPGYWRFYVRAQSFRRFGAVVGSWHPRKRAILEARLGAGGPAWRGPAVT